MKLIFLISGDDQAKTARLLGVYQSRKPIGLDTKKTVGQIGVIGEKVRLGFKSRMTIWYLGQQLITGKSVSTDLLTRKKTYPSLVCLDASNSFRNLWQKTNQFAESDLL